MNAAKKAKLLIEEIESKCETLRFKSSSAGWCCATCKSGFDTMLSLTLGAFKAGVVEYEITNDFSILTGIHHEISTSLKYADACLKKLEEIDHKNHHLPITVLSGLPKKAKKDEEDDDPSDLPN